MPTAFASTGSARDSTTMTTVRSRTGRRAISACAASSSTRSASAVIGLRRTGLINDDVMKRVQRDIDLEAARLDVPG